MLIQVILQVPVVATLLEVTNATTIAICDEDNGEHLLVSRTNVCPRQRPSLLMCCC